MLQTLENLGYRVSAQKAQICQQQVMYLGYVLKKGKWWLSDAHKETVLKTPTPTSIKQVREFWGTAGFCRLWTPGFVEIAKPLYEATKEKLGFVWTDNQQ